MRLQSRASHWDDPMLVEQSKPRSEFRRVSAARQTVDVVDEDDTHTKAYIGIGFFLALFLLSLRASALPVRVGNKSDALDGVSIVCLQAFSGRSQCNRTRRERRRESDANVFSGKTLVLVFALVDEITGRAMDYCVYGKFVWPESVWPLFCRPLCVCLLYKIIVAVSMAKVRR